MSPRHTGRVPNAHRLAVVRQERPERVLQRVLQGGQRWKKDERQLHVAQVRFDVAGLANFTRGVDTTPDNMRTRPTCSRKTEAALSSRIALMRNKRLTLVRLWHDERVAPRRTR